MPHLGPRLSATQVASIWAEATPHDVTQQPRDHGRWSKEPGSPGSSLTPATHSVITADEMKDEPRSRGVSAEEFHSLAEKGKSQFEHILRDTRPAHAFEDADTWTRVKGSAYRASRASWGGQTIDPATGQPIERDEGFSVSVRRPGQPHISVPEKADEETFNEAMNRARHEYAEQLGSAQCYLGVFRDDKKKTVDIDPVYIAKDTDEVESIGAYTHAVGGAYDFKTGNGYFPPHVRTSTARLNAEQATTIWAEAAGQRGVKCPICHRPIFSQHLQHHMQTVHKNRPAQVSYAVKTAADERRRTAAVKYPDALALHSERVQHVSNQVTVDKEGEEEAQFGRARATRAEGSITQWKHGHRPMVARIYVSQATPCTVTRTRRPLRLTETVEPAT